MVRINQLVKKKKRPKKKRSIRLRAFNGAPMRKGVCMKVYTVSPKKPNSAVRKVAKISVSKTKLAVIASIPGNGHSLMQYSVVLIRGGRIPDLPGVKYKLIRGKYDFIGPESLPREKRRSKFGKKRGISQMLKTF